MCHVKLKEMKIIWLTLIKSQDREGKELTVIRAQNGNKKGLNRK